MSSQELAEAYAFSKLTEHLRMRTDVQNIDVMVLAGFCRNCLTKWCLPTSTAAPPVAATYALLVAFAGITRVHCATGST